MPDDTNSAQAQVELNRVPELADALQRGAVTLFIGSDLPSSVTGLPSRRELAGELAKRHNLDQAQSLAEVAQRVSRAGNRWAFTTFIRDAMDTTGKAPQRFHQRIAATIQAYPIRTIITVAYDNLLGMALLKVGIAFNSIVRSADLAFVQPERPTVLKLYGDTQQPDTLVVTEQDHSALLHDHDKDALIDEVRSIFRRSSVLFLGYDLSDPDFRFVFDRIAASRFARTAYAVWPGLSDADVVMWRERGIIILNSDPLGIIPLLADARQEQEVPNDPQNARSLTLPPHGSTDQATVQGIQKEAHMKNITKEQQLAFHQALLAAYPTVNVLEQMVLYGLDENLAVIAGGTSLQSIVFNLIKWAVATGRWRELIAEAEKTNPGNPALRAFIAGLEIQTGDAETPTDPQPLVSNPPSRTHPPPKPN